MTPIVGTGSKTYPLGIDRTKGDRSELFERLLSNPKLSSPPTLALRIVERTRSADCTVEEISELLAKDPALCGKLLKTLNSPLYSFSSPVASLHRAVVVLGLKPLRSLILGLTLPAMHSRQESDEGTRNYWKDSVAGAIIARELSKRLKMAFPEDDMVASLLRDLGMMVLHQAFGAKYQPIWEGSGAFAPGQQCQWEERHLNVHHAEVSAALLSRWGLPADIVEPIKYHHHPHLISQSALPLPLVEKRTYLLDLASRLAQLERLRWAPEFFETTLRFAHEKFGLPKVELEKVLASVRPQVQDFAAIVQLDIGECPNFGEVLAAGCEEMIRLSAENVSTLEQLRESDSRVMRKRLAPAEKTETQQGNATASVYQMRADDLSERFLSQLKDSTVQVRVQQYVVQGLLGRGAMGIVLKAHDEILDRPVALKFLEPNLASSTSARRRFALEGRYAASIRHENVVSIFAVSDLEGVPFLVMQFVGGASLEDRLERGEQFAALAIARIGRQIALGLACAHDLRLIHRDIKPANILVEDGTHCVRVTDFGLARATDRESHITQNGLLVGTPLFMSPEQVDGLPLTPASDLFSLGSVLYTLCTETLPFSAETLSGLLHAVVEKQPAPIQSLNPAIPSWLSQLVERLHAKNPAHRFPSAAAVADYLKPWLQE